MLQATVGILAVSAMVFVFGWISARRAARSRNEVTTKQMHLYAHTTGKVDGLSDGPNGTQDNNRENPKAMMMASSGDISKN